MKSSNQAAPHYEGAWSEVDRLLAALETRHPPSPLDADVSEQRFFQLFNHMLRYTDTMRHLVKNQGMPRDWSSFLDSVDTAANNPRNANEMMIRGQRVKVPIIAYDVVYRDIVSTILLVHGGAKAECFAELGSGWSANIFNLWRSGAPLDAAYFGCELTDSGRRVAGRLAAKQNRRRYQAVPFDHRNPDLKFLPPDTRSTLLYTCHSLEQVERIDERYFDRLVDGTRHIDSVRGVHIEPVAWQYGLDTTKFATTPPWALEGQKAASRRHQNVNLKDVLSGAEARGVLRVTYVELHSITTAKDYPTATIAWTRC